MKNIQFKFNRILERDIDFIFIRALYEYRAFLQLFLEKIGHEGAEIVRIEHSQIDINSGESDIVVYLKNREEDILLFIENKIDSPEQKEQYARYKKRAKEANCKSYIFVIAPQKYLDINAEAKKYDYSLSYELATEVLQDQEDEFAVAVLNKALDKSKSGYQTINVPEITSFWKDFYEYVSCSEFDIEMFYSDKARGAKSLWLQFKTYLKGTELYYKSDKGKVELHFNSALYDCEKIRSVLAQYDDAEIHYGVSGMSNSVWIKVDKMDFHSCFSAYPEEAKRKILIAVERLSKMTLFVNDRGI